MDKENQHFKLSLPLEVYISKFKKFRINLNTWGNAHFAVKLKAKEVFTELIKPQIEKLPFLNKIKLTYTTYRKTNGRFDLDNTIIVSKFFCDALTEALKITDDNSKFIQEIVLRSGGTDKDNPRCDVDIEVIE